MRTLGWTITDDADAVSEPVSLSESVVVSTTQKSAPQAVPVMFCGAATVKVTLPLPKVASAPMFQTTLPPTSEPPPVAETKVVPGGSGDVSVTPVRPVADGFA